MEFIKDIYSCNGRINRKTFWKYLLILISFNVCLFLIFYAISDLFNIGDDVISLIVFSLYIFTFLWPMLCCGTRRLHDMDRSGWLLFLLFIPLIGLIVILIFTGFLPGKSGLNKYDFINYRVKDLFSFSGRATRSTFWGFTGIILLVLILLIGSIQDDGFVLFGFIIMIPLSILTLIVYLGVTCKRWHDIEKSGWWSLIFFVPVIGQIWAIIELGFKKGTYGKNKYGLDPQYLDFPKE